jgi:hypothetical protein
VVAHNLLGSQDGAAMTRRRAVQVTAAVAVAIAVYVAAFFMTRKWVSITLGEPAIHGIRVYYFSSEPTVNRVLYGLFYPIVIVAGYPVDDGRDLISDYHARINGPYYSSAVEELQLDVWE